MDDADSIAVLGSLVVLDDLDERTREEYVLVQPAEANPAEGRLSQESPVGKALVGHHRGDVVSVLTPRSVRHLRLAEVHASRDAA